ncbi:MAG: lysophospholipase L1-like esterase [Crocinitomicaceae bacterium]|jgi:lysophospholipase L1-like esterase
MLLRNLLLLFILSFYASEVASQTNPCVSQNVIRVVVLGSSTAAGTGPSTADSAWVNRYRNYVESINSSNEVINLAVGGYTTYKIMRTGFTPPPGRPTPDITKNISAALALNPDAIIVNMPSNDVSSGFTYLEQIDNLDSIVELSTISSVPIWICTTQPKNFSDSVLRQLQSDIKDTILARYAPRSIDFWTGVALGNNTIDPTYDSGDGTHLNDAGHALLSSRVIEADLPLDLYTPGSSVDYAVINATPQGFQGCGDASTLFTVMVANLGIDETISSQIIVEGTNLTTGAIFLTTLIQTGGILACQVDTLNFTADLSVEGNYSFVMYSTNPNDTIGSNDSLTILLQTLGHPVISAQNDTLCESGNALLSVTTSTQDTVFWYLNPTDLTPIEYGQFFSSGFLSSTTTWYAEAVRGDLFYRNSLETTLNSNINFNGAMFDVVAQEDVVLDSFFVKINTLGMQEVEMYTKAGSHLGYETNAGAWTFLGSTFVEVVDDQAYTSVPIGDFSLSTYDTLGVYVQMVTPTSRLSYASVASPITRSTGELELITGSGAAHDFGGNYYPRDLNFGVHYHFGDRPEGECSTGRIPVTAFVSNTTFDLGNDTIIDSDDSITFYAPQGYFNYSWSTGGTSDSNVVVASDLGNGVHYISVSFEDSLGCERSDSLVIAIADLVGLQELSNEIYVYPNPTSDELYFSTLIDRARILTPTGSVVMSFTEPFSSLSLTNLSSGSYFIEISVNGKLKVLRFVMKAIR